jgi:hypothetical protein
MEEFTFKLLDRYGVSIVIVVVLVLLVWRVLPDVVKVWIDKIRAETSLIQATQEAVTTKIPTAIGDLKTTFVAEHKATVDTIKSAIGADTDRRIEEKLSTIEREQQKILTRAGSIPDVEAGAPPSRAVYPSRPGG